MLSREELVPWLIQKWQYTPAEAQAAAEELLCSHEEIQQAFEHWRTVGELPELEVEGYSLQGLVSDHGLHPVGALLTLDWLLTEPELAKAAIEQGYDTIRHADGSADGDANLPGGEGR